MNKLQQTLVTLKMFTAWENDSSDQMAMPDTGVVNLAITDAISILEAVETFLTNRQKNNCSSACSPLVSIAEGA
jgi:hypothetical protein